MSTKERPNVLKFPEVKSNPEHIRATQTKSSMSSRVAPEINISSDEEEDEHHLNKTLPHNFKFRYSSTMQSPTHSLPSPSLTYLQAPAHPRAVGASAIRRRKPVNCRPNLVRYRHSHLGTSDPALTDPKSVISPEDSFEDSVYEEDHSHVNLRLPVRTQSLNQPKSPHSPRISSPSSCDGGSGSPRMASPSVSNFERFSQGRRSEVRRWSLVSQSSGYTTGLTDSPASLSSYPSQEHIHHQLPTTPTQDDLVRLSRHFRSDSSGSGSFMAEEDLHNYRPRARSLSPERSPRENLVDIDDTLVILKSKYPRAKDDMEIQLEKFLLDYSEKNTQFSDSNVNFARQQLLQLTQELLEKSRKNALTKDDFLVFSENVDHTIREVYERNKVESPDLKQMVKKLLSVISRVARLVEIIEFNPTEFTSSMLQLSGDGSGETVGEWFTKLSSSHMPYILSRLKSTCDSNDGKDLKERPTSLHLTDQQSKRIHPKKDDFDVIKIISNGAYGAVYLVRHKQTRKRFAMKKVSKKRMIMKKQVQQIFTERDILTFAENPFVVGLWCTFQTRNHLYMVMEYVEGGDLATLLKNVGCLPIEITQVYFSETVLALEYIHSCGIIHRDLKPDNLLITSEGHIKLTDFGLSKIGLTNYAVHIIEDAWSRDAQFIDPEVYGTPDYIAPEVILGQPYAFPVDWWSMGVILFEMLVGVTPFTGRTVQELFDEITNEHKEIPWPTDEGEEIHPSAQDIVHHFLCFDPMFRLGSVSQGGVGAVREHEFFDGVDWNSLLRQKAEFIPLLQGEEDTSYFDIRSDRYSHEFNSDEEEDVDSAKLRSSFHNFTSTAPRMSAYLDETKLSQNRISVSESDDFKDDVHNRDSGIVESDTTSILDKPEVRVLSPGNRSDHTEEEEENLYSNIDAESSDEDQSSHTPVAPMQSKPHTSLEVCSTVPAPAIAAERQPDLTSRRRPVVQNLDELVNTAVANTLGTSLAPSDGKREGHLLESPRHSAMKTNHLVIEMGPKGYGMILKSIRVYIGDSNNYRIHHIVQEVERGGPAWKSGLRRNSLVTHINGEAVTGLHHVQLVNLMVGKPYSKKDHRSRDKTVLTLNTIPLENTSIRQDSRKRLPWLGRRIGKLLRKHSSRVTKRSSFLARKFRPTKSLESHSFSSSSGTPSPKLPSSPRRSESMKDSSRVERITTTRAFSKGAKVPSRRKQTPVSPLARSTSPVALSQIITPNCSPPGSTQNLSTITPPNSPPITGRSTDRHQLESTLLTHRKSMSTGELLLNAAKQRTSPQTSPLLKRAVSPSPEQQHHVRSSRPRRSSTLERTTNIVSQRSQQDQEEEDDDQSLSFL